MIGIHLSVSNSILIVSSKSLFLMSKSGLVNLIDVMNLSAFRCLNRVLTYYYLLQFPLSFLLEPFECLQILICELPCANERIFLISFSSVFSMFRLISEFSSDLYPIFVLTMGLC